MIGVSREFWRRNRQSPTSDHGLPPYFWAPIWAWIDSQLFWPETQWDDAQIKYEVIQNLQLVLRQPLPELTGSSRHAKDALRTHFKTEDQLLDLLDGLLKLEMPPTEIDKLNRVFELGGSTWRADEWNTYGLYRDHESSFLDIPIAKTDEALLFLAKAKNQIYGPDPSYWEGILNCVRALEETVIPRLEVRLQTPTLGKAISHFQQTGSQPELNFPIDFKGRESQERLLMDALNVVWRTKAARHGGAGYPDNNDYIETSKIIFSLTVFALVSLQ